MHHRQQQVPSSSKRRRRPSLRRTMAPPPFLTVISLFTTFLLSFTSAHNITEILSAFPDYSLYNSYLSQTKVSDEINSRETITVLVLPNPVMSTLAANRPLSAVKNALRLLTLLDYYDSAKLHDISDGTVLTTTLLQTTGSASGNLGFVNITDLKGGKVGFGSTFHGANLSSTYTKMVKKFPYSISVLEISAPITFPGLLDAPPAPANITTALEKAGCKTFSSLIVSSGVIKMYQSAMDKGQGLTLFAPNDEAFKAATVPDLNKLSQAELVTLLQYHALPEYAPKASLQTRKGRINTMATSGAGKFDLSVVTRGDDVSLGTGVDSSRIASTVVDDAPFCLLTVDGVLLPVELFGKAPAPAPGVSPSPAPAAAVPPAPAKSEAPAPDATAATSPTEEMTPEGAPAEGPSDEISAADTSDAGAVTSSSILAFVAGVLALTVSS